MPSQSARKAWSHSCKSHPKPGRAQKLRQMGSQILSVHRWEGQDRSEKKTGSEGAEQEAGRDRSSAMWHWDPGQFGSIREEGEEREGLVIAPLVTTGSKRESRKLHLLICRLLGPLKRCWAGTGTCAHALPVSSWGVSCVQVRSLGLCMCCGLPGGHFLPDLSFISQYCLVLTHWWLPQGIRQLSHRARFSRWQAGRGLHFVLDILFPLENLRKGPFDSFACWIDCLQHLTVSNFLFNRFLSPMTFIQGPISPRFWVLF